MMKIKRHSNALGINDELTKGLAKGAEKKKKAFPVISEKPYESQ